MANLTLKRKPQYYGALRILKIELNETEIPLWFNGEHQLSLKPGHYTLVARMDWAKSEPLHIELANDDHKVVLAGSVYFLHALIGTFIPPFNIFTLQEINK